jgi:hypothetical protein
MPPQSQTEAGSEARKGRRAERRLSGRAQRRVAQEEAERRKRLTLIGSLVGVVALIALIAFLLTRPPDLGPPIVAAEPLPASIPVEGRTMGSPDAPVTVLEWGDYT